MAWWSDEVDDAPLVHVSSSIMAYPTSTLIDTTQQAHCSSRARAPYHLIACIPPLPCSDTILVIPQVHFSWFTFPRNMAWVASLHSSLIVALLRWRASLLLRGRAVFPYTEFLLASELSISCLFWPMLHLALACLAPRFVLVSRWA